MLSDLRMCPSENHLSPPVRWGLQPDLGPYRNRVLRPVKALSHEKRRSWYRRQAIDAAPTGDALTRQIMC